MPRGRVIVSAGLAVVVTALIVAVSRTASVPGAEAQTSGEPYTGACPSDGTPAARLGDPLDPPEVEADDVPTPASPDTMGGLDSVAAASPPANPDLVPLVRTSAGTDAAPEAAESAGATAVELSLRWCVVQPTRTGPYAWRDYEQAITEFRGRGVDVRTLRVLDTPDWASADECETQVEKGNAVMCPPMASRDPELQAFASALAKHFGPSNKEGTGYFVDRLSFWNEPNYAKNWGAATQGDRTQRARRYSDRLLAFHAGATSPQQGDQAIKIDAGEVASGSKTPANGGTNAPEPWAEDFTDYNSDMGRNDRYNVLTIHAYSESTWQIPAKVDNYLVLRGVDSVGVTEVGWAVSASSGNYKCVPSETAQASRFSNLMSDVRSTPVRIHRVAWFNLLDNRKGELPRCPDRQWYNVNDAWGDTNSYGLFKRLRDGTLSSFADASARPLKDEYIATQP